MPQFPHRYNQAGYGTHFRVRTDNNKSANIYYVPGTVLSPLGLCGMNCDLAPFAMPGRGQTAGSASERRSWDLNRENALAERLRFTPRLHLMGREPCP